MGVRLALLFAEIGHQVILGSRDRERTARIVGKLGRTNIQPGSYQQAVDAAVVLPAMFLRDGALDTLEPFRINWTVKFLSILLIPLTAIILILFCLGIQAQQSKFNTDFLKPQLLAHLKMFGGRYLTRRSLTIQTVMYLSLAMMRKLKQSFLGWLRVVRSDTSMQVNSRTHEPSNV